MHQKFCTKFLFFKVIEDLDNHPVLENEQLKEIVMSVCNSLTITREQRCVFSSDVFSRTFSAAPFCCGPQEADCKSIRLRPGDWLRQSDISHLHLPLTAMHICFAERLHFSEFLSNWLNWSTQKAFLYLGIYPVGSTININKCQYAYSKDYKKFSFPFLSFS